jgi:CheY-like chemotaxis protein
VAKKQKIARSSRVQSSSARKLTPGAIKKLRSFDEFERSVGVVIADDNENARWLVLRLLSDKREIVSALANGRQLVDAATALRPDVIVSDISMPLVTGPEAMRELRASGMYIPFVLISVNSIAAEEYIQAGAMG